MSLIKSLIFGQEGTYKVLGVPVRFQKINPADDSISDAELATKLSDRGIFVFRLIENLFSSKAYLVTTQSYVHTFVHEMSHALADKFLCKGSPEVEINDDATGLTTTSSLISEAWKSTVFRLAGSMGDIAFSTGQLVAITSLRGYLTTPGSLMLGAPAVLDIASELFYSFSSGLVKDDGDFGEIAKKGRLGVASAALITEIALSALSIYSAYKLTS